MKKIYIITLILAILGSCKIEPKINEKIVPIEIEKTIKDSLCQFVNPFIGTGGEGHTYPGATVPFGMVQLSPDTEIKHFKKSFPWCAGYQYNDKSIIGFSLTHFSGTGHSDMGDVLIMPTTGELKLIPGSSDKPDIGYRSRFSHENESAKPGYYQVLLEDYNINVELTTSERCGFHKYKFNTKDSAHILIDLTQSIYNYYDKVLMSNFKIENDRTISGYRQTSGWAKNRYVFFTIKFSKPFTNYGLVNDDNPEYRGFGVTGSHLNNYPEIQGKKLKAYFNFDIEEGEEILVKVGISAVDKNGSINNLISEIPHWNFEQTKVQAREKWENQLKKFTIETNSKEREIFYTSVYHTMLAPTIYMDADKRYRGVDNTIHVAKDYVNYSTFSLWDTYRALHPLFTIIETEKTNDFITSMINHSEQNVHRILPIWSFHGNETWCMIGYHAVSVIADAYLKGIHKFNVNKAYNAMIHTANYNHYGGIKYYKEYGYVPIDLEKEGASKTLEYAYDDWAIAQMAKSLRKNRDYRYFINRAQSFENIFDDKTLFMRARKSDGKFRKKFDPLYAQYGGDYTEGNAWQYSWYVPHNVERLIELLGGEETFVQRLDSLFKIKGDSKKYKHVEDIAGLIGQYAHGNEPSQHIAYLYNYAKMPWKTQEKIHLIMDNLFDNTPDGICGNEDCGQMSAWYIFSSLGFYPVCPGSLDYAIGSPRLKKAAIHLENGETFKMEARNLSDSTIYIEEMYLNGVLLERPFINHEDIMNGGELVYIMTDKPVKREY
jgi:predicted alpha-1,2-mannosidase